MTNLRAFEPLRSGCPVCAGARRDCRKSSTGLVHCRSGVDAPGWRFIGEDSIGFGMYTDAPATSSADELERYRRAATERAAVAKAQKLSQSERALNVDERDRQYRTIARHSGLSAHHRNALVGRGYTPEQIESGYQSGKLWTWATGESIPGLSTDLAGVQSDGTLRRFFGMAIAVPSPDGKLLGAQIRVDKVAENGSKYFWVSSANDGGCSPALKNGEMPIGFYKPDGAIAKDEIDIGEGFLKSHLTATRHGRVVIGAAGANFAASPEQFEQCLSAAFRMTGSRLVILNADGEAISNRNVMQAYEKTAKLVKSLGYDFRVRWWGQFTKGHGDADEIDNATFENAQLLTLGEFQGLSPIGQGFGVVDGGKADDAPKEEMSRDQLIAKRLMQYRDAKPFLDADYKLSYQPGTRRDVAYFEGRDDLDFNEVAIAKCPVIAVRGFLSVGKTHKAIAAIRASVKANGKDQQFIWISTRNGLLRQTEQRAIAALLGIPGYFYQDDVTLHRDLLETRQPGLYFITDASFSDYHVEGIDWSAVTCVVDEWAGLRAEVISKSHVLPEFERMLAECRSLWVLDAFLGEADLRVIEKYRANRTQWAIFDQIPTKAPKTMRWIETRTKKGDISLSHDGVALTVLERWFGGDRLNVTGLPYVMVMDNLLAANAVKRAAIEGYRLKEEEIILISSQTVEASHTFMPNPDAAIRAQKPRLVILTPTAQSGVDIQEPFAEGLGLFCGVLSGTQALQMIGRARQCNEWLISAPRRQIDGSGAMMDGQKLARSIKRLPQALEAAGAKSNRRTNLWSFWQTQIRQLQRQFNSEFIHDLLIEHYETVETIELANPHQSTWKELCRAVKLSEADKKLRADAKHGQEMRDEKQSPSRDQHVWDIALAEAIEHYTKPVKELVAMYKEYIEQEAQGFIGASGCLRDLQWEGVYWFGDGHKSLKRYIQTTDRNPEDDEALRDRQGRTITNFATGHHIQYRNQELFRALNLEQLAKLHRGDEGREVDDDVLDVRSPIVASLWSQFLGTGKLARLFPQVHDIGDFWRLIKKIMSYFGFRSEGKNYRVESDKPAPNGLDRNGRQRYSKTKSAYFVGWFARFDSGSRFERENFELIVEAIRDRLAVERAERRARARTEPATAPPHEEWGAAA